MLRRDRARLHQQARAAARTNHFMEPATVPASVRPQALPWKAHRGLRWKTRRRMHRWKRSAAAARELGACAPECDSVSTARIRASSVAPNPRVASNHGGAGRALLARTRTTLPKPHSVAQTPNLAYSSGFASGRRNGPNSDASPGGGVSAPRRGTRHPSSASNGLFRRPRQPVPRSEVNPDEYQASRSRWSSHSRGLVEVASSTSVHGGLNLRQTDRSTPSRPGDTESKRVNDWRAGSSSSQQA